VTAAALITDLCRRGVRLIADGDSLRCRAPRGELTEADLIALRECKAEILEQLHETGPADAALLVADTELIETVYAVGAVLVRSPRYGEVWLALGQNAAEELAAEETARKTRRPVLLAEDVARLAGKSEAVITAALEVARTFPGARIQ